MLLFILVFVIGMGFPFLLIKIKSKWARWVPTILFLIASIIIGGKAMFFPAPEMAFLGEVVYFMLFGTIALGAFIGGLIVRFFKK